MDILKHLPVGLVIIGLLLIIINGLLLGYKISTWPVIGLIIGIFSFILGINLIDY